MELETDLYLHLMKFSFLIGVLISFSAIAQNDTLIYEFINYDLWSKMTLNPDSTFKFEWKQGLLRGTTEGKWQSKRKKLVLTSELQPTIQSYEVIESKENLKHGTMFKLLDNANDPLPFAIVGMHKKGELIATAQTELEGIATSVNSDFDSLSVNYVGYPKVRYQVKDSLANSFVIIFDEWDEMYRYFTGEKWKLKKDRLYDPQIRRSKYIKKPYLIHKNG